MTPLQLAQAEAAKTRAAYATAATDRKRQAASKDIEFWTKKGLYLDATPEPWRSNLWNA